MARDYEVSVSNFEADKMSLIVLSRTDKGEYDHPCHLFVYTGEDRPHLALLRAAREYGRTHREEIDDGDGYLTWFDMMGDGEDYHEIFAEHGLVEANIPMGLQSIVVRNNDSIEEG
jgi:hypothetical protein